MKRLFKFKYPKIMLLVITIILAYVIFRNPFVKALVSHFGALSYLGIFIAGMLFSFGFTAPFAAGFFITLNPSNILAAGIIGGLGALISDLIIFATIKLAFKDEFKQMQNSKTFVQITKLIEKDIGKKIRVYLMYVFAGILIASPLPDEAGVTMLAGLTKISAKALAIISFILNTFGIIILLLL